MRLDDIPKVISALIASKKDNEEIKELNALLFRYNQIEYEKQSGTLIWDKTYVEKVRILDALQHFFGLEAIELNLFHSIENNELWGVHGNLYNEYKNEIIIPVNQYLISQRDLYKKNESTGRIIIISLSIGIFVLGLLNTTTPYPVFNYLIIFFGFLVILFEIVLFIKDFKSLSSIYEYKLEEVRKEHQSFRSSRGVYKWESKPLLKFMERVEMIIDIF